VHSAHSRRSEFPKLETYDGLAAKVTVAQLFEHLAGAVQFKRGADARSDHALREHARDFVQSLRR
jgi:hypothetical protein